MDRHWIAAFSDRLRKGSGSLDIRKPHNYDENQIEDHNQKRTTSYRHLLSDAHFYVNDFIRGFPVRA